MSYLFLTLERHAAVIIAETLLCKNMHTSQLYKLLMKAKLKISVNIVK